MPREIILREDGTATMRSYEDQVVGVTEEALGTYFKMQPRILKDVMSTRRGTWSVLFMGNDSWYFQKLSEVRLKTYWQLDKDGCLYPVFKATPSSVLLDIVWTTEECPVDIWYGYACEATSLAYMFAVSHLDGLKVMLPPLPNLFKDSRMCTGHVNAPENTFTDKLSYLEWYFDTLEQNPWGTDLLTPEILTESAKIFKISANGEPLHASLDAWQYPEISVDGINSFVRKYYEA